MAKQSIAPSTSLAENGEKKCLKRYPDTPYHDVYPVSDAMSSTVARPFHVTFIHAGKSRIRYQVPGT